MQKKFNRTHLKSIIKETIREMRDAQIPLNASSLAYTTILSLVPLLAMSFAVFQSFGGMEKAYAQIQPFILSNLADNAGQEAIEYLEKFIGNIHGGTLGVTGFIGLLFTSMSMLSSVENTFNRIWNTQNKRAFFHRVTNYWFFITLGPLLLSVVLGFAGSSALSDINFYFPKGVINLLFTFTLFFMIYKGVPNCKVDSRSAIAASAFSAVIWFTGNKLFLFYTQKALSYNKIYGSLGAIPLFFLWIYVMWIIILTGAALSYVIHNKIKARSINEKSKI